MQADSEADRAASAAGLSRMQVEAAYNAGLAQLQANAAAETRRNEKTAGNAANAGTEEADGRTVKGENGEEVRTSVAPGYDLLNEKESQRVERLRTTTFTATTEKERSNIPLATVNLSDKSGHDATITIGKLAYEAEIKGTFHNDYLDIDVDFGHRKLDESISKQRKHQRSLNDFAKMLTKLSDLIKHAIPIETHNKRYDAKIRDDITLEE